MSERRAGVDYAGLRDGFGEVNIGTGRHETSAKDQYDVHDEEFEPLAA
jgi:hypothetical protein